MSLSKRERVGRKREKKRGIEERGKSGRLTGGKLSQHNYKQYKGEKDPEIHFKSRKREISI